jgi:5-guanidino-2-oxopentanoate decarboxylase
VTGNAGRNVGQALVALLKDYGVDMIFGIPGVHNNELYRGLLNSGMRHILARHEQGAGFMADGYARATGRPGVCFTITGPGLTNIMTPMGQAYSDSIPMMVFSSALDVKDQGQGRGRLHEITDQYAAASTVSGYSAVAKAADDVPEMVAQAWASFSSGRPRPAYVELPIDVLASDVASKWAVQRMSALPHPDPAAIAKAAEALKGAKRPVIIAGGGAISASGTLGDLASALNAIVITTISGKGVVPQSHPLCAAPTLPQTSTREFVGTADVVLAVGTELAETDIWCDDFPTGDTFVRVDIDANRLTDRHGGDIAILADAGVAVTALLDAVGVAGGAGTFGPDDVARIDADAAVADETEAAGLRKVLGALRAALPDDTIMSTDMTKIAYAGNEMFSIDAPRLWMHPVGYGTLGYALPAAIGAKLGAPDKPVVALAGDYGFQYTLNELAVAAEAKLDLIVVMWNNQGLKAIIDDMDRKKIGHIATNPVNPDYEKLAGAYGYAYQPVTTLDGIGDAVAKALADGGPQFIELDGTQLL